MASNLYTRKFADGTETRYSRKGTQGRKKMPQEFRRPCRVIGSVTQDRRKELDEIISGGVLKESDILDHALGMWLDYFRNITVQ